MRKYQIDLKAHQEWYLAQENHNTVFFESKFVQFECDEIAQDGTKAYRVNEIGKVAPVNGIVPIRFLTKVK